MHHCCLAIYNVLLKSVGMPHPEKKKNKIPPLDSHFLKLEGNIFSLVFLPTSPKFDHVIVLVAILRLE